MSSLRNFLREYPVYACCMRTLEDASKDDEGVALSTSLYDVLNFDEVAKIHLKENHYNGAFPSVDAVFISSTGHIYFIEFKNGKTIKREDINHKACGSLIFAQHLKLIPSLDYVKSCGTHIIVYNSTQQKGIENYKAYARLRKLSKRECRLQQAKNLDWMFSASYSYNQIEFEKEFVQKVLEAEDQKISS